MDRKYKPKAVPTLKLDSVTWLEVTGETETGQTAKKRTGHRWNEKSGQLEIPFRRLGAQGDERRILRSQAGSVRTFLW